MEVKVLAASFLDVPCDLLAVNIFEDERDLGCALEEIDKALNGHIRAIAREIPDSAKFGQCNIIHTLGQLPAKRIALLGSGKKEDLTLERLRFLTGFAARVARKQQCETLCIPIDTLGDSFSAGQCLEAAAEGAMLGAYCFEYYKSEKEAKKELHSVFLVSDALNPRKTQEIVAKAKIVAEGVNLSRDIVNHPGHFMTPQQMASFASKMAKEASIGIEIINAEELKRLGMNGILAVGQGSSCPPLMIVLEYKGNPGEDFAMAWIGKGITFDTGGISLKPSTDLDKMKDDKGGGAAVIGAMAAIGRLRPRINILGLVPCAENMPSGNAYRPGDIIQMLGGKTVEVVSTDAEGRLLLADAISYAVNRKVPRIVDIATLTGACVVALGSVASGMMTNCRDWGDKVKAAAEAAGEKFWELPSYEEYVDQIKSTIADWKNSGGRDAGAITAGLFLIQFAGKTPLVHLDIAGTVTTDKEKGYNVSGATGVGVRTLVRLAEACALEPN